MKVSSLKWAFVFLFAFIFAAPMQASAEGLSQDMTQGEFASWLVKAMGAQSQLSPGATDQCLACEPSDHKIAVNIDGAPGNDACLCNSGWAGTSTCSTFCGTWTSIFCS